MKRLALLALFSAPVLSYAQDQILKHDGNRIDGKVISVGEYSVTFSYPGETASNTVGKSAIDRIIYSSGRVQPMSDKRPVYGKDDWEKVLITSNPDDVLGLRRMTEIRGSVNGDWNFKGAKGMDRKATEKIKKEAAKMGAHTVLLLSKESERRKAYNSGSNIQTGIAYGY